MPRRHAFAYAARRANTMPALSAAPRGYAYSAYVERYYYDADAPLRHFFFSRYTCRYELRLCLFAYYVTRAPTLHALMLILYVIRERDVSASVERDDTATRRAISAKTPRAMRCYARCARVAVAL